MHIGIFKFLYTVLGRHIIQVEYVLMLKSGAPLSSSGLEEAL